MPYSGPNDIDLPEHVQDLPAEQRRRWVAIFNGVWSDCMERHDDRERCESRAFRVSNGVLKRELAGSGAGAAKHVVGRRHRSLKHVVMDGEVLSLKHLIKD